VGIELTSPNPSVLITEAVLLGAALIEGIKYVISPIGTREYWHVRIIHEPEDGLWQQSLFRECDVQDCRKSR
jgi:hypothetical protein